MFLLVLTVNDGELWSVQAFSARLVEWVDENSDGIRPFVTGLFHLGRL